MLYSFFCLLLFSFCCCFEMRICELTSSHTFLQTHIQREMEMHARWIQMCNIRTNGSNMKLHKWTSEKTHKLNESTTPQETPYMHTVTNNLPKYHTYLMVYWEWRNTTNTHTHKQRVSACVSFIYKLIKWWKTKVSQHLS